MLLSLEFFPRLRYILTLSALIHASHLCFFIFCRFQIHLHIYLGILSGIEILGILLRLSSKRVAWLKTWANWLAGGSHLHIWVKIIHSLDWFELETTIYLFWLLISILRTKIELFKGNSSFIRKMNTLSRVELFKLLNIRCAILRHTLLLLILFQLLERHWRNKS